MPLSRAWASTYASMVEDTAMGLVGTGMGLVVAANATNKTDNFDNKT